jgi:hypothetical protein
MSRLLTTFTLSLLLVAGAGAWHDAGAQNAVPTQYLAKLSTEALGSVPNRESVQSFSDFFASRGCNQSSVREIAFRFFDSDEFKDPYAEDGGYDGARFYDRPAAVLTLFRALLNREPDPESFANYLNNTGASILDIAHFLTTSDEFVNTVLPAICGASANYAFGTAPAIPIPVTGPGFVGDGVGLQNLIDLSPGSSTITLAQKALIVLQEPLYVPPGFTVTTQGQPGVKRYALMARLVRGPRFPRNIPTVILGENAALTNVWVDGQRVQGVNTDPVNADIVTLSGSTTRVENNRLSNAAGDVSVFALGRLQTLRVLDGQLLQTSALCSGTTIRGNLITGYTGVREGIQNSCEHAVVENNQIVDVTSVGIRLLGSAGVAQTSQVRGNLITSAGLNAGFGILADPRNSGTAPSFTGSSVAGNTIVTGPRTGFAFGLGLGNRVFNPTPATGTGASFTGNTLAGNYNVGIGVSGIRDVVVQNNALNITRFVRLTGACPAARIAVGPPAVSSGTIQPPPPVALPDLCF